MISLSTFHSDPKNEHSLILLHAFPLSSIMYDRAAAVIAEHAPAYNIILADFPGFGSADPETSWTISGAMVELHSKLEEQDVRNPVIAGLSMGGYAALAYYRLYQNEVKALILSNTKAATDDEKGKKGREEFALDVEARGADAVYDRMLEKLICEGSKKANPELITKIKQWIALASPAAIAAALRALALRDDSTDLLATISCPTLLITGEDDAIIPSEEMEKMAAEIKGSKFVSFTKAGHLTALEDPEKWGSIVSSFLNVL